MRTRKLGHARAALPFPAVKEQSAELRGVSLHWREAGEGDAVVLLHGFPLHSRMWAPQLETLSASHRCIAPDTRGFGRSAMGAEPFSMDLFADDVAALLDHLGVERATLCGLSMGGYVAFAFWRRHRARVERLILADTRATADDDAGRMRRRIASEEVLREGASAIAPLQLDKLLGETTRRSRPRVVEEVRAMMDAAAPRAFARAQSATAARPDSTRLLPDIDVPALVVVGDEDALIGADDARAMAGALPHGRLSVIEGAGHLASLERPAEFDRVVEEFLDG